MAGCDGARHLVMLGNGKESMRRKVKAYLMGTGLGVAAKETATSEEFDKLETEDQEERCELVREKGQGALGRGREGGGRGDERGGGGGGGGLGGG